MSSAKKRVPKGYRFKPKIIEELKWLKANTNHVNETDIIEEAIDRYYKMRKANKEGKDIILD
jgi:hypothetical protein